MMMMMSIDTWPMLASEGQSLLNLKILVKIQGMSDLV
jgi:hypothetical protein